MLFGKELRKSFPIFNTASQQGTSQQDNSKSLQSIAKKEEDESNSTKPVEKKMLCYLDNAASTQKPQSVIDTLVNCLSYEYANIHRGAYRLSAQATEKFESVREKAAVFVGANSAKNIVFTKGATDSINLAAYSLEERLNAGDYILLSLLEHHSNIVPWQIMAKRKQLKIAFTNVLENGELDLADFRSKLNHFKPKIVSISALANSIGSLTPIETIVEEAKTINALVLIDAAQYCAHKAINVSQLGCDFLAFSSHKLYGPTACGVLYCSDKVLELMQPVFGGGDMISSVSTEGSTWAEVPHCFEAGTPAIAEVIALAPALDFVSDLLLNNIGEFEDKIFEKFYQAMVQENGLTIYGPGLESKKQSSVISFNVEGVHPHDMASIADSFNVQIRAGHHCAQPLMTRLGLNATARVSLACYSDVDQIEPLIEAVRYAKRLFC